MNVPGTQNEPTREPVVDAHTHIFPDEIIGDRANFLARDLWFEHLYASPRALLVGPGELIASMDTAGIEQSVICGFPWRDPGLCRIHNDFMADVSAKSNGRLPWLGIVAPGSGTEAVNEAQRCFDLGASGLGELNADAQSFDLTDTEGLKELFEFCFESNRPIMLHASEPVGHHYPGKGASTPDRLLKMIQALPEVRFVLAHWGGGLPFFELMPEVEAITSNIWYDTAASTYLYRWGVFRSVLDIVGPDRVLFASDYPILKQDRFIQKVQGIPWKDNDERKAVLCENARNVYGLKP